MKLKALAGILILLAVLGFVGAGDVKSGDYTDIAITDVQVTPKGPVHLNQNITTTTTFHNFGPSPANVSFSYSIMGGNWGEIGTQYVELDVSESEQITFDYIAYQPWDPYTITVTALPVGITDTDLKNNEVVITFAVDSLWYCSADLNHNGVVDGNDLAMLLSSWGQAMFGFDLDGDTLVTGTDIAILLGQWGSCPKQ